MFISNMNLFLCVLVLCNVSLLDNFVDSFVIANDLYRLDIVHYNDFHDRFEETSIPDAVCRTNDTRCLGGFARLYQEIMALIKEKPDALLLNAGDTFQGTYWYTLLKWNVTQTFINMLPNDAHAIGNHEFDGGIEGLVPYLEALRAPVLAANIDVTQEPSMYNLFKPHIIVERKGRKIGIIGLITPDTAITSNAGGVKFTSPVDTARNEAKLLTKKGVDIIIVLSHCGLNVDKQIATTAGENIDIIVGGHTHSLLWNGGAVSGEVVSGPYPVIVESEENPGHKVLVVTASAFTKYLGNLTAYFNWRGELQSFDGEPIFLNRSIPEDPAIKALLQPYAEKLHTLVNEVVGEATSDFLANACGSCECAIGNLIADSFLNKTKEMKISNFTNVAFLTRNMIRGSVPKGEITRGTVINALPFTNNVATVLIKGKYIVEALEICFTTYWNKKPIFSGPWMPHVAGMKVTLNPSMEKATSVLVQEGKEFIPIDPEKDYQLTTTTFMLEGGNAMLMLRNGRNPVVIGTDTYILEDYIKKISPITPYLDGRLTVQN